MINALIAILGILLTIFFVVGVHELGHFLVARWMGVKVLLFSIGFGKPLYRWHDRKGTEYVVAAIPLGGYVKMLDEQEATVDEEDRKWAYNNQSFYKKFLIVLAGPLFNVLFAFLIYWIIFMIGFTGIIPVIGQIKPNSIAASAGMKPNQEIIQVDQEPTESWMAVLVNLMVRTGDQDTLSITTRDLTNQKQQAYQLPLENWHVNELKPDPLESLGMLPWEPIIPPVIGSIAPDSPASGILEPKDKIIAINDKPISNWNDLSRIIEKNPAQKLNFKIQRNNKIVTLNIQIDAQRDFIFKKHGYLGIGADYKLPENMLRTHQYGPLQALIHAWREAKVFVLMNLIIFGKLVTGKVSFASLGGPISIFQTAGNAINQGILPFLGFLAFLSIAIGLVNILPIPGLDGGHILFQIIEVIIRRPIPFGVQLLAYRLGLVLLFLLLTKAIVNDILRF